MIKRVVLSAQAQADLAALDRVIALRILGATASPPPAPATSKVCAAFIRPMSSASAIARTPIGEATSSLVFFERHRQYDQALTKSSRRRDSGGPPPA